MQDLSGVDFLVTLWIYRFKVSVNVSFFLEMIFIEFCKQFFRLLDLGIPMHLVSTFRLCQASFLKMFFHMEISSWNVILESFLSFSSVNCAFLLFQEEIYFVDN